MPLIWPALGRSRALHTLSRVFRRCGAGEILCRQHREREASYSVSGCTTIKLAVACLGLDSVMDPVYRALVCCPALRSPKYMGTRSCAPAPAVQGISGHGNSVPRFCHQFEQAAGDLDGRSNIPGRDELGRIVADAAKATLYHVNSPDRCRRTTAKRAAARGSALMGRRCRT